MRFVPVSSLVEGMICGKTLYDINSQMLLNKGSVVQKGYIQRIQQLGYQGIYVEDEMSNDIVVKDVISDELRMSAVKVVRDICIFREGENVNKGLLDKK